MSFYNVENKAAVKGVIIGILASAALTALLSVCAALILGFVNGVPYDLIDYIMAAISGASVLFGSYIASAVAKSRGLIIGALCGAVMFLLQLAVGMGVNGGDLSILTAIKAAVMLIAGIAGGIKGVNRKEKLRIK